MNDNSKVKEILSNLLNKKDSFAQIIVVNIFKNC